MRSRLRSVLALVGGFVVASVVMMAMESLNGKVLFPELGRAAEGLTDREAIRALMAGAPTGAFLVVLFGWALGSFLGALVTSWIGRRASLGLVLGALLTVAGVANNLMLPPPAWFWVVSLVVLLPAAWAGARLATRAGSARNGR